MGTKIFLPILCCRVSLRRLISEAHHFWCIQPLVLKRFDRRFGRRASWLFVKINAFLLWITKSSYKLIIFYFIQSLSRLISKENLVYECSSGQSTVLVVLILWKSSYVVHLLVWLSLISVKYFIFSLEILGSILFAYVVSFNIIILPSLVILFQRYVFPYLLFLSLGKKTKNQKLELLF